MTQTPLRLGALILLSGCHLLSGVGDYRYDDNAAGGGTGGSGDASGGNGGATNGAGAGLSGGGGGGGGTTSTGGGTTSTGSSGALENGAACNTANQCASTFCADGVCCDRPCHGACEACRLDLTGSPDGSCAGFPAGTEPQGECGDTTCLAQGLCCGDALDPPGGICPPECTGGCDADNLCTIACGNSDCDGATLTCPQGFDCRVSCAGGHACKGALALCPDSHECTVDCGSGNAACDALNVVCSTGPCRLNCPDGTCDATTVLTCGTNACNAVTSGNSAPTVDCGQSCDCSGG
jgi:hypothetical protein